MVQEASGSHGLFEMTGGDKGFEIIQDKDTQPSENTSKEHNEVAPIEILVELPPNGRTIRSKWLFKKKTDMDGNVHTFKARLVAKGYTQTYRVDYGETFTLVTDNRAIRILLAMAAFYDYEIWQMDVKTAFLNGHLSEDVYMVQPEGFVDPKHPNKDDTKSLTGYVFVLNGGVVDWKSAKQSDTTMTSTEAKYIATAEASIEAVWMRKFIDGLGGVMPSNKRPMEMLCDNKPTLAIAEDPRILKGARHF
ncbi:retrotransposon protein, putative, ty1-copia subclass [Tanacetum coccineum]